MLRFSEALRLGLRGDRPAGQQLAALGAKAKHQPVQKKADKEPGPLTAAARRRAFRPCRTCMSPGGCASEDACAAKATAPITKAATPAGAALLTDARQRAGEVARARAAAHPNPAMRRL